jgi:hypothetical protein
MTEQCTECFVGKVTDRTGSGRMFTYRRGLQLELPEYFAVPTCDSCGAEFFGESLSRAAMRALQSAYQKLQRRHVELLIQSIQGQLGVTLRDIEEACGVTPTSLNHLLNGRSEAVEPLIGLLEAFALHPQEVNRRLARTCALDTESVKSALLYRAVSRSPIQ